jgi:hypothetical protein
MEMYLWIVNVCWHVDVDDGESVRDSPIDVWHNAIILKGIRETSQQLDI